MESLIPSNDGGHATLTKLPNLNEPQDIVTIYVRNTPFRVHRNFLCHYSPFFEAAFEGHFAEAESQEMRINDISAKLFGMMINWLYSQEILNEDGTVPPCRVLVDLWILADRFMISALQNQTIEAINDARLGGSSFTADIPHRVYENTGEDSPLRSYLVDMCIEGMSGSFRETDPPQFLVDVINGMRARAKGAKKKSGKSQTNWRPSKKWMKIYHVEEVSRGSHSGRPRPSFRT